MVNCDSAVLNKINYRCVHTGKYMRPRTDRCLVTRSTRTDVYDTIICKQPLCGGIGLLYAVCDISCDTLAIQPHRQTMQPARPP